VVDKDEDMAPIKKHTAQGYITVVQEQRFRLITDTGQGLLLTLAYDAPLDSDDLQNIHKANMHVIVEYEGEPNRETGVAHSLKPNRR
jgi:hypothetical protein